MRERCVVVNSFSKTYAMTGWRLGYCAAPRTSSSSMFLVLQQSSRGPATFIQDAGAAALTGPQDCVREMRAEYARSPSSKSIEALSAGFQNVDVLPPEGGFFAMIDMSRTGLHFRRRPPASAERTRRRCRARRAPTGPVAKARFASRSAAEATTLAAASNFFGTASQRYESRLHLRQDPIAHADAAWSIQRARSRLTSIDRRRSPLRQGIPSAVLHRRQRLSDRAARRRQSRRSREDIIRIVEICRKLPMPAHDARRRHIASRPGHRRRPAGRHLEVLQPDPRTECRGAMGARPARHRTRRTERAARSRTACASRPTSPPPAAPPSAA